MSRLQTDFDLTIDEILPPIQEWPWRRSSKGNLYTRGPSGHAAVISERDGKFSFAISPTEGERWRWSLGSYLSLDDAKLAALRALGVNTRQPVPPGQMAPIDPYTRRSSESPTRRIVL